MSAPLLPLSALCRAFERREAKPSEALEASLRRIARIDGKVHAFLRLT